MSSRKYFHKNKRKGDNDYRRSTSGVSNSKYSKTSSSSRTSSFGKADDYSRLDTLFEKTKISSRSYRERTHTNGDPSFKINVKSFADLTRLRNTNSNEVMLIKFYPSKDKSKDTLLPVEMELSVNNKKINMPPINDQISGRLNCPIEVDPNIIALDNYIRISSEELEQDGFAFSVVIAKLKKPKVVYKQAGKWNMRSREDVIAEIKSKLSSSGNNDDDEIISTSTLVLKLTCPLGMSRMVTPARFKNCNHLNCFEITTFSKMKKKDKCPVCMKKVSMKEVFVDEYMKEICHKSSKDLVQLNADGGWNEVEDKNDQAEEIADDDEEEEILKDSSNQHTATIDLCSSTEDESSSDDDGSPCNCADCTCNNPVIELSD